MNNFDLSDRLNWQQACTVLGCKKSAFYRLIEAGEIKSQGIGTRFRWYSRADCLEYLEKQRQKENEE